MVKDLRGGRAQPWAAGMWTDSRPRAARTRAHARPWMGRIASRTLVVCPPDLP